MALKDIIGHEGIIDILRGYIKRGRLPHALLFAGDDGIGKKLTALNLAKALNCHRTEVETTSQIDSCDKCPSCLKIDKLFYPETLVTPEDNEKTLKEKIYVSHPDVALILPYNGEIRIEVIRKLEGLLAYKPFEGAYKIAIIDNAEMMNNSAANAFLNTLESPPSHSILILISSKPDMLLPTIRSRCQRLNFSPLPLSNMDKLLRERLKGLDHEQSMLLCELSGGRVGYALNEDLIKQRDRTFDMFLEMLGNPAKDFWKDKHDMEAWFEWCELWLRDIAVFKATGDPDFLINKDREAKIRDISREIELEGILKLSRELYNIKRLLNFNLNKQITLYYINLLFRAVGSRS